MNKQKTNFKSEKELQEAILIDKARGIPDIEIGQTYGVTYRYIEKVITKLKGVNISTLGYPKKIRSIYPRDFKQEKSTVWSFRQRGNWATHTGAYRGNFSPYIPRNIILKYSKPGDLVLDYFCGAGTTAVEAMLLGRRCIAFDINDKAIDLAKENINFTVEEEQLSLIEKEKPEQIYEPKLSVGDARYLSFIKDNSVDLICSHPPYANIIHYTDSKEGDLSFLDIDQFLEEMFKVAKESYRVLKPGKQCAILIGDTRRKKHVAPLGFKLIDIYLNAEFKLKELVIKRQHNCKTTGFWHDNSIKYNFLLLAHEYLPIFEKPKLQIIKVKESREHYYQIVPLFKKPKIKGKLDEFETTTVWIFEGEDFEENLNNNVIDRYSDGTHYIFLIIDSSLSNKVDSHFKKNNKTIELLFIKSPFLKINMSQSSIELYLKKVKDVANEESLKIKKGGFFVIQTQDTRVNGYIVPMAKEIIDSISSDNLSLKEIIVVTQNKIESLNQLTENNNFLKINHQYLLVYEKIK
jgi:DNA modification methylase